MADDRIQRVVMPKWGLSMKTGKVTEWIAAEGDEISSGDDLAEVETDKIAGTIESTWEGQLRRIVARVGSDAPVGATIAVIAPQEVPDEEVDAVATEAAEQIAAGEVEEEAGPRVDTADVDGRSLSYSVLGEDAPGEPLVLVHGYGGDKNSWLFVQEPLAQQRPVYALDLPGHGASGKDLGGGDVLGTLTRAVTGFLDALGIARAHLVGHSLGGAVSASAAEAAPQRVASLTLLAPAGFGSRINADYVRGFAAAGTRRELKPHVGELFADSSQATRQIVDDLLKYKRLDGVGEALSALVGALVAEGDVQAVDVQRLTAGLDVPVIAVWGEQDRILPADNAAALPEAVRLTRLDEAGHMVHMEAPRSVVEAVGAATGER
ncbi:acetoin dehydrogenase dihydrolipoyllysine-residue acetyltransferase subunit [Salinifilum aidingensis]